MHSHTGEDFLKFVSLDVVLLQRRLRGAPPMLYGALKNDAFATCEPFLCLQPSAVVLTTFLGSVEAPRHSSFFVSYHNIKIFVSRCNVVTLHAARFV